MTSRPEPVDAVAQPPAPAGGPDPGRRALVRGAALLGVAGLAGVPLAACGGGGDVVSADGPPPLPEAQPPKKPLPTKSQVYRRTPEPRSASARARATAPPPGDATGGAATHTAAKARTPARAPTPELVPVPEPVPVPAAKASEPAAGSKGGGAHPTARKAKPADGPAPVKKSVGGLKTTPASGPTAASARPSDDLSQAKTSDIPVGGGRIYPKDKVVVTQPTAGTFKGFSATCTHAGCLVSEVGRDGIVCSCHGSRFGIADGSVLRGPAILPLPAEQISVHGDRIVHGGHGGGHVTAPGARRFRRAR